MERTRRIRVGRDGSAALYEMRGLATRILDRDADVDQALDLAARFIRTVEPKERERVLEALRREELGALRSFPTRRS